MIQEFSATIRNRALELMLWTRLPLKYPLIVPLFPDAYPTLAFGS
jgi:hypothetical protein